MYSRVIWKIKSYRLIRCWKLLVMPKLSVMITLLVSVNLFVSILDLWVNWLVPILKLVSEFFLIIKFNSFLINFFNHTDLLEKARVISQQSLERSYHIFYQIMSGAIPGLKGIHFFQLLLSLTLSLSNDPVQKYQVTN